MIYRTEPLEEDYLEEKSMNKAFVMPYLVHKYNSEDGVKINGMADLLKKHYNPGFRRLIDKLDEEADLIYIKRDHATLLTTIPKIRERIELCNKYGECDKTKKFYKGIKRDYIDKGVTVQDCDKTLEEAKKTIHLINARIKEVRNQKRSTNEDYIEEMKRSELPKEVFGIPQERKYPMPDEQHVRSAIKFFNHVEPKYEKQLANNIIKKMKEYDIDGSCVGEKNRLKQYLPKSMLEQMIPDKPILVFDFGDVLVDCRYGVRAFTYTEPLLKELKRYGYKLYYLSNWDEESCKRFIQDGTFDFIKYFDGGVFSWELELEKPDDNIYKVFLYKYNLMAKDCLFFDDKHENIIAAKEVGMNAMQFNHAITPLYIITKFINKDGRSDLLEVLESSDMSFDSKEKHFTSPVSKRKFSTNEDFLNRRSRPVKNQKAHQSYLKRKEKQNKTNNATAQYDMPTANQFGA